MLDGSIIKVHQDAMRSCYDKAAEAIGSSVGGLSTKIHAKVDSFGQLINVLAYWYLSLKFKSESIRSKMIPKMLFSISAVFS